MRIACLILFLFKKTAEQNEQERLDKQELLCRFVIDGVGKTVGESIAIQNDLLIVKKKEEFLGVPLKHIEIDGKKLLVKGLVDTTKAKELGKNWQKNSYQPVEDQQED